MKSSFLRVSSIYEFNKVILNIIDGWFEIFYLEYTVYYKSKKSTQRFNLYGMSRDSIKISPNLPALQNLSSKEEKINYISENWMEFIEFALDKKNQGHPLVYCKKLDIQEKPNAEFDADYNTKAAALQKFDLSDDEKRKVPIYSPYAINRKVVSEWFEEDSESFI